MLFPTVYLASKWAELTDIVQTVFQASENVFRERCRIHQASLMLEELVHMMLKELYGFVSSIYCGEEI